MKDLGVEILTDFEIEDEARKLRDYEHTTEIIKNQTELLISLLRGLRQ
jgi:hypothetical protein